jgi:phosphoribosylformimino-5-aminoimidazole carboxamide ribonucleotide (ProFAR) isomerase
VNGAVVAAIVGEVGERMRVEIAGGLRTEAAVNAVLASGPSRVIIGTAALRDPSFAGDLVTAKGADRIAVAIDVRDGHAVGHGWVPGSPGVDAADAITRLSDAGVTTFEVTAIHRDGLLGGPDLALYERLIDIDRGSIIASGGVATIEDVIAVRDLGCAGVIVGRALVDGSMDLADALSAVAT